MKAVFQRVTHASVTVAGESVAAIDGGALLFVGVVPEDTVREADLLANKIANLRVFEDENGKMNRSLLTVGGAALVVSQFTLCANTAHGRRPDFFGAAAPAIAAPLVERVAERLRQEGVGIVQTGRFGADMQVELLNDGPVTILLDTDVWKGRDGV